MGVSCERNEASDLTLVGTGRATRLAGTRVVSSRLRVLVSDVESGESPREEELMEEELMEEAESVRARRILERDASRPSRTTPCIVSIAPSCWAESPCRQVTAIVGEPRVGEADARLGVVLGGGGGLEYPPHASMGAGRARTEPTALVFVLRRGTWVQKARVAQRAVSFDDSYRGVQSVVQQSRTLRKDSLERL